MSEMIMTVRGPIPAAEAGFSLVHEHVLFNTSLWVDEPRDEHARWTAEQPITLDTVGEIRRDPTSNVNNLAFHDVEIATREVALFREAGGGTIFDMSPIKTTFERVPSELQEISAATGVNIVMGSGYYVAASHPPEVAQSSVEELAAGIIDEFEHGLGDTGVKPGVIGEIGCSGGLHPEEVRVLRAAALAQQETGLGISIHPPVPYGRAGVRILDVLIEAGADPQKVVMGHLYHSISDLDYHRRIADTGALLAYDRFGAEFYLESWKGGEFHNPGGRGGYREPLDWDVCEAIAQLVREGYADRIVMSHDIAYKVQLRNFGGTGFGHIINHVLPKLKALGITDADIEQMTVKNPARVFSYTD